MGWLNGHVHVNHPREPWGACCPDIIVHCDLATLYGRKVDRGQAYLRAKTLFDQVAAEQVVKRVLADAALDTICDEMIARDGLNGRLVLPFPDFDDELGELCPPRTNALPYAYAGHLSEMLGLPVDEEIMQVERAGRTKLTRWQRFLWQPSFGGRVRTDEPYILVDDVATTGGTLAALRSYIVRNGGTVLFATAIANRAGRNQAFPITQGTLKMLSDRLGAEFEPLWRESVGHDASCLTEFEGKVLLDWCDDDEQAANGAGAGEPLLQRLRARLDAAATS